MKAFNANNIPLIANTPAAPQNAPLNGIITEFIEKKAVNEPIIKLTLKRLDIFNRLEKKMLKEAFFKICLNVGVLTIATS